MCVLQPTCAWRQCVCCRGCGEAAIPIQTCSALLSHTSGNIPYRCKPTLPPVARVEALHQPCTHLLVLWVPCVQNALSFLFIIRMLGTRDNMSMQQTTPMCCVPSHTCECVQYKTALHVLWSQRVPSLYGVPSIISGTKQLGQPPKMVPCRCPVLIQQHGGGDLPWTHVWEERERVKDTRVGAAINFLFKTPTYLPMLATLAKKHSGYSPSCVPACHYPCARPWATQQVQRKVVAACSASQQRKDRQMRPGAGCPPATDMPGRLYTGVGVVISLCVCVVLVPLFHNTLSMYS